MTAEQFLSLVSVPIGAIEKALKEPLTERGVTVKDHKRFVESLLIGNIEYKEKAMSVKAKKQTKGE